VRRGGPWLSVYKNSLSLAFLALFLATFLLHALTGSREFNSEQASAGSPDRVSAAGRRAKDCDDVVHEVDEHVADKY
jgi:hypothetical protein